MASTPLGGEDDAAPSTGEVRRDQLGRLVRVETLERDRARLCRERTTHQTAGLGGRNQQHEGDQHRRAGERELHAPSDPVSPPLHRRGRDRAPGDDGWHQIGIPSGEQLCDMMPFVRHAGHHRRTALTVAAVLAHRAIADERREI